MQLAPDAALWAAMLARVPLTFALDLDTCAVDQQVQRTRRAAVGDVDLRGFLVPAQRAEVRHSPVQIDQPRQALDEPSRLAERHTEQQFHRQAGLDRAIAVVSLSAAFAGRGGLPSHGGIKLLICTQN